MIVAVLSTSVMPADGTYRVETVHWQDLNLRGIPHYIGHVSTRRIVENLGAVPSFHNNFHGLKVGESAVCCPIAHDKKNKRRYRFTRSNQRVNIGELAFRILTRIG